MKILLSPEAAVAPASGGTTTATPTAPPAAPTSSPSWDSQDAALVPKPKPAPAKALDKAQDKPADKAPEPTKDKDIRTMEPKALRQAYEKLKGEAAGHVTKISDLEKRIADAESKGKDTSTLTQRLAQLEKELDETRGHLRAAKQEKSPEFIEKYEKPFNRAANAARNIVSQLQVGKMVSVPAVKNEMGEVITPATQEWRVERNADWDKDFGSIYSMPYAEAKNRAKAMFGDDAQLVMDQYIQLRRMNDERQEALKEEQANWAKKAEEDSAREIQQKQAASTMQEKVRADISNKFPDWYKEIPGDDEGNKFLKDGTALVNAQPQTFEDWVIHKTQVELRAAAFGRAIYKLNKANERIAELEGKLSEQSDAEPGKTKRTTTQDTKPAEDDWKSALRKSME